MKFRNIKTIIAREYSTRVKKKSFLLVTFLGPIFFAAMCILPSVIMFMTEDKGKTIGVIADSRIVIVVKQAFEHGPQGNHPESC